MKLAAVATAAGVAYALGWLTCQPQVAAARREANTDALTGLVNRHGLKRQLHIWALSGQPYTIYLLDLNGFKPINDDYGHRAGDALLRQLGIRLRRDLSPHPVARLGGDEFVVAIRGPQHEPDMLLARIHRAVQHPVLLPGSPEPVTLSASIGYAAASIGDDYRETLHAADQAMYRSKRAERPIELATLRGGKVDESPSLRIRDARTVRVA